MEDNLEVYFCDLCNTSVPQRDLDLGAAVRVKGRVLGSCCLGEVRGSSAAETRPGSKIGIAGAAVIMLAAVAGTAMFVDWRMAEEFGELQTQIRSLEGRLREDQNRLRDMEVRLGSTVTSRELAGVRDSVAQLGAGIGSSESTLRGSLDGATGRIDALSRRVEEFGEEQARQRSGVDSLRAELRQLGEELAAALARPRPAPVEPSGFEEEPPMEPAGAAVPAAEKRGLPADLTHQIAKLKDADPGTRFEAVDKLIQSQNPAVLEELIQMTKDSDLFVRRLTVEGLRDFREPESVDALIESLADPEGIVRHTAYTSLQKLTGQNIAFDPEGKRDERRSAQRRWQDWWRKNRESF